MDPLSAEDLITIVTSQPQITASPPSPAAPPQPPAPLFLQTAATTTNPNTPVYPFLGMNIDQAFALVDKYSRQNPPAVYQDEYTIVRNGREIPIFKPRRDPYTDQYQIIGSDGNQVKGSFSLGSSGTVDGYRLSGDLVNLLFNAANLPASEFVKKFSRLHKIPQWRLNNIQGQDSWEYLDQRAGYKVTIFGDKSMVVERLTN
jgi:hypothetical protein